MNLIVKENTIYADSREVAEMVGKRHKNLLRDIDGYVRNLGPTSCFVESSYTAGTGKRYRCYLITRKGCEVVANQMTGRKGIQFTAASIEQFLRKEQEYWVTTAVRDVRDSARTIQDMFHVKRSIALMTAINLVEQAYDVDLDPIRELLGGDAR